jgi:hypothetical protein
MLLSESTDIPSYLIESFERTLSRGVDITSEDRHGRRYDLELPSIMWGLQLVDDAGVGDEAVREQLINDGV